MAKVQSRRGVSLNRAVYVAIREEAERQNLSMSHFIVNCCRPHLTKPLPESWHMPIVDAKRAVESKRKRGRGRPPGPQAPRRTRPRFLNLD